MNIVAKFTSKLNHIHFIAMKRIYKYVCGTIHWGICYQSTSIVNLLELYAYVDFVVDLTDKKSRLGFVVQMNGGPIS
jgi:hypothetical protein